MKVTFWAVILLAVGSFGLRAQTSTNSDDPTNDQMGVPGPTEYHVVESGANYKPWQRETHERLPKEFVMLRGS